MFKHGGKARKRSRFRGWEEAGGTRCRESKDRTGMWNDPGDQEARRCREPFRP